MKLYFAASVVIGVSCSVFVASSFTLFPTTFGRPVVSSLTGKINPSSVLLFPRGGSDDTTTSLSASVTQPSNEIKESQAKSFVSDDNLALLSARGKSALLSLIEGDKDRTQTHVYAEWPPAGEEDEKKKQLCDQVSKSDYLNENSDTFKP